MWKNWNPFKRKTKEEVENVHSTSRSDIAVVAGKENHDRCTDALTASPSSGRQRRIINGEQRNHKNVDLNVSLPAMNPKTRQRLNRGVNSNTSLNLDRNKSFSGVHGPLLSSPIVPHVRRAVESQAGIFGTQGKKVSRSTSLNYGNLRTSTRSTAGQVPWVRLKRRESIGLHDLAAGNMPQSPNTVKLTAPESSRRLPPPPSFKSTPVIVTTEPNRSRVVDTQTVVSALREKRKRFGSGHPGDSINEDSFQGSIKRRRQDSSQSNASSVSIPPMPDSLPDLMAPSSASSLLHIESLSSQRPSTVPANVDPYNSNGKAFASKGTHIMGGLGGLPPTHSMNSATLGGIGFEGFTTPVAISHGPPPNISSGAVRLPFYNFAPFPPPSYQQLQTGQFMSGASNHNSSATSGSPNKNKTLLRSIQSSLSSSTKTRVNVAKPPQQGGDLNLKRVRGTAQENARRLSFSSGVRSTATEEPVSKISKQSSSPPINSNSTAPALSDRGVADGVGKTSEAPTKETLSTVSTPTKRKIAEGVMLRKQNLSMGNAGSPARPTRTVPATGLVSTEDFESDRKKEYQRRVLDMLGNGDDNDDDDDKGTTPASTTITTITTTSLSSNVNASLASLNKLVQSTTPTPPPSSSSTPSSATLSAAVPVSSNDRATTGANIGFSLTGKPLALPSSDTSASGTATVTSSQASGTATSGLTSGLQVNFGSTTSSAGFTLSGSTVTPQTSLPSGTTTTSSSASTSLGTICGLNFTSTSSSTPGIVAFNGLNTAALSSTVTGATNTPSANATSLAQANLATTTTAMASAQGFNFTAGGGISAGIPATFGAGAGFGQTPSASTTVPAHGFNLSSTSTSITTPSQLPPPPYTSISTSQTAGGTSISPTGGFNFGVGLPSSTPSHSQAPTSGFNFGAVSATSASSGFSLGTGTAKPNLSTTVASFGNINTPSGIPAGGTSQSASVTTFGGFGGKIASTLSSGFGSTAPVQIASTLSSGFTGFGSTAPVQAHNPAVSLTTQVSKPASAGGLFSPPSTTLTSSTAPAVFGAGLATATSANPAVGSNNGGIFGSSTAAPAFNFSGGAAPNTAAAKPFTFGATSSGAVSTSANTTPFGSSAPPGLTVFGSSSTPAQPPAFGAMPASTTNPVAVFGASAASTNAFSTTATSTQHQLVFGATATSSQQQPVFGATATSSQQQPAFGAGLSTSTAAQPSPFGNSNSRVNMFGAASQPNSNAATGFGSGLSANPATIFGAGGNVPAVTTPAPTFGASSASTSGATGFGVSAAAAKPFSIFGSSNSTSSNAPSNAFGSGASAFGSGTNNSAGAAQNVSVFGAGATQTQTGAQPFAFGGGANTSVTAANAPVFGTAVGTSATSPFGQAAPTSNSLFGSSVAKPAFGSASTLNQAPAFGSGNTTNVAATGFGSNLSSAPAFGSANSQPAKPAFGASGFGSAAAFGSGQPTNQNTGSSAGATGFGQGVSVFGAGGNTAVNKPSGFGAGSSSSNPGGAFNFGAGQQQSTAFGAQPVTQGAAPSSMFAFGQAAPNTTAPAPQAGGAFNFAAAANQPASRPVFPTPSPAGGGGGFNFAAAAGGTPSFNFNGGGAPAANMFTPPAGSTPKPRAAASRRTAAGRRGRR